MNINEHIVMDIPEKAPAIGTKLEKGFSGDRFLTLTRARKASKRGQMIVRKSDSAVISLKQ